MREALTATDHLAAVVDAWNAFDDDTAVRWETRMQNAVSAAECFLRPRLDVETDPAPSPRSLVSTDPRVGLRGQEKTE